jgi:alpha-D-ribose 1-methylphosphonate 5-triphosphate diphosphatase PhnM
MADLSGANAKLLGQLNTLENIYSNPNIPEGQLAEYQQTLRSGLKTLGVEVAPETGITDFAKAIGTSLALTQKNADGKNLLPGAMSNYEDQLLQKMAPTLSLTQEGRLALVQFMKQVAQSNMRIANEATQMASANKDQLPSGWYQRKERVMLEEMAKLKAQSDQIVKQYGGGR